MLAALPIVTAGYALMTPSLQAMVSKRTPADRQGAVLGVNQSTSALARIVGLTVGPALLELHLLAPYIATAVLMLLVGVMLATVKPKASAGAVA
jgi:predicted MFS family arabinose efflux permease